MTELKNKTALVVDDDNRNIFAIVSYLDSLDMKSVTAENGRLALDLLEKGTRPDIILLDIMMPEMDGFETLARLKSHPDFRDIPVIAVTARSMLGDRQKCLDAGAQDYVSKPINMPELTMRMMNWI